jgi:hypothetical protein
MNAFEDRRAIPRDEEADTLAFSQGAPLSPLALAFAEATEMGDVKTMAHNVILEISREVAWLPPRMQAAAMMERLREVEDGLTVWGQSSANNFNASALKQFQDELQPDELGDDLEELDEDETATFELLKLARERKRSSHRTESDRAYEHWMEFVRESRHMTTAHIHQIPLSLPGLKPEPEGDAPN